MHVDIKDLFLTGFMVIAQLSFLFLSVGFWQAENLYHVSPKQLNSFNYSLVYKKPKIIEMFFSFSMHVFFFHFIQ